MCGASSVIDQLEHEVGGDGDAAYLELVVKAAKDEIDSDELRTLAEMAKARGMEIRKPRHIPGGQAVRSLEAEIALMKELIQGEAESEQLRANADPEALGRANAFAQETARLKRELETSREPELKRLRLEELGESGRQSRIGDIKQRLIELRRHFSPTPKAEPVSGMVVTNLFSPNEVPFQSQNL